MVCQLLVELLLKVSRAAPVRQVSVRGMRQEELPLRSLGRLDVLLAVNILLTSVDNAHVASPQREAF